MSDLRNQLKRSTWRARYRICRKGKARHYIPSAAKSRSNIASKALRLFSDLSSLQDGGSRTISQTSPGETAVSNFFSRLRPLLLATSEVNFRLFRTLSTLFSGLRSAPLPAAIAFLGFCLLWWTWLKTPNASLSRFRLAINFCCCLECCSCSPSITKHGDDLDAVKPTDLSAPQELAESVWDACEDLNMCLAGSSSTPFLDDRDSGLDTSISDGERGRLPPTGELQKVLVREVCDRDLTHGRLFCGAGCRGLCAITEGEGVLEAGVPLRAADIWRLRTYAI